jgi:tetratricopeptide (TPR) repeat protein
MTLFVLITLVLSISFAALEGVYDAVKASFVVSTLTGNEPAEEEGALAKLIQELKKIHPDYHQTTDFARIQRDAYEEKAENLRNDSKTRSEEYFDSLRLSAEYGLLHCALSHFESFLDLKKVCAGYKELGELKDKDKDKDNLNKARIVYEKLLKIYEKNPKYKNEVLTSIYPAYGEVLNTLQDFDQAKPIWLKLLGRNNPSVKILRSAAFCLGGWLEYDGQNFIEIPGSGDYVISPEEQKKRDAKKVYLDHALGIWRHLLRRIDDAGNKYTPEWWEAKFYTVYSRYRAGHTRYRAGEHYPLDFKNAKAVIKSQRRFKPDMGGPDWQKKFDYIEKAIKERD